MNIVIFQQHLGNLPKIQNIASLEKLPAAASVVTFDCSPEFCNSLRKINSVLPIQRALEEHIRTLTTAVKPLRAKRFANSVFRHSFARRTFFSSASSLFPRVFGGGSNSYETAELERLADAHPQDAKKQALFYRQLTQTDPESVIKRFEDERFARNDECIEHYLCALYELGRLDRAAAFIRSSLARGGAVGIGISEEGSSGAAKNNPILGTKDRPLFVHNTSQGSNGWRRFSTLVNVAIVGGILWSLFNFNEQRLGGITTKVHRLFSKESSEQLYSFDDVQGCDEAKQDLQEVVEFLKNPAKFNKLGAKMPKGVLLVGPPGTGKTLLAKAVAGEAEVPFLYASGSSFEEVFVGVGSARIRQMFESAKEQAPCIIFIDELDAIGSKRNPRDPQHSRMSLNQLLTEMDGFAESKGIVVIAATNIPEALDRALLRPGRFDKHVQVPLPDMKGRRQIVDRYLRNVSTSPDVDVQVIARATPGFSGADLAKMINQAKIIASVENGQQVTMQHLERSKDEMILGTERRGTIMLDEERRLTAYHEGGHALVALYTPHAMPIHKATIIPRGRALGMVSQLPERDELSLSKAQLLARMDVSMGGRVAEELVFGGENVTTGASSDFSSATAIARAMVTQYGMSERVGPIVVEDLESLSAQTRDIIDAEVKVLLEQSRLRALTVIREHRGDLDRLASALLEYETLSKDELVQIVKGGAKKIDRSEDHHFSNIFL